MKHFSIDNERIPAIGLGTYKMPTALTVDVTKLALQHGYTHIDTAQMYKNEAGVGAGIKASGVKRQDIFLVTKVLGINLGKKDFLPSVEESLRKLQTDYVDLLLIHWPHVSLPMESYLEELMKAQAQGKTRLVGVSNFNVAQLTKTLALKVPIVTNQVEFHPLFNQTTLYQWMAKNNLLLTAYAPLARGHIIDNPTLQAIGKKYGKSTVQVNLRWMMQLDGVIAIPKTVNVARLKENIDLFDFELNEEEMASICKLKRLNQRYYKPIEGAKWDM